LAINPNQESILVGMFDDVGVGILVGNNLTRDDPSYTPLILCGVVGFVTMTINLKR
jgi:hypothetical protein